MRRAGTKESSGGILRTGKVNLRNVGLELVSYMHRVRHTSADQLQERSPKYADKFLDKVKPLLVDPKVRRVP